MSQNQGSEELRAARRAGAGFLVMIGVFSAVVNVLMLTGSLFMLQVYDRVLGSRSEETLLVLFLLVAFLYALMAALDLVRNKMTGRLAARFQRKMEGRVFAASLAESGKPGGGDSDGLKDLDSIGKFWSSPVMMALFDLPWAPLFLLAVFVFHPVLGLVATVGGIVLLITTVLTRRLTQVPLQQSTLYGARAQRMADLYRDQGEAVRALGMGAAAHARWEKMRRKMQYHSLTGSERGSGLSVFSKSFRLFLQSALLAAGAWLVLRHEITPGAMIASSIMMGRALAPVEQLVGGWPSVQAAQDGWRRLSELLSRQRPETTRTPLPRPEARLEVRNAVVVPPGAGAPTVRGVSFGVAPGRALGIIGPSGAGKSTLAKAAIGAWPLTNGSVRLGGATLDQYGAEEAGRLIGYVPQSVSLFDGTIAENIARLDENPDLAQVVRAAQAADAHQMIVNLPDGYDTRISQTSGRLSGGQIQRIGLARALYSNPVLLVLDEPNANLDAAGSEALNVAVRRLKAEGGAVIIVAHRPAAINECDTLLMLEQGMTRAFGPRDKVLEEMVQNAQQIQRAQKAGDAGGVA